MKSWFFVIIAGVAAVLGYQLVFAPDSGDGQGDEIPAIRIPADQSPLPAASAMESGAKGRPPSLGLGLTAGPDHTPEARPPYDEKAWKLYEQYRAAVENGQGSQASLFKDRILKSHPRSDPARHVLFEEGRPYYQRAQSLGRTREGLEAARDARRLMTPALFLVHTPVEQKEELRVGLRSLTEAVLFSPSHVEKVDFRHIPRMGDSLGLLRQKIFVKKGAYSTPEFIAYVSGLKSPGHLRANEPIKVPYGKPRIIVVKREYRLYLLLDDAYVKDYPIGLGRENRTPEARFVLETKIKNPDWYAPDGRKIPYGDPANILGSRWLGFRNTPQHAGYGIHGTMDPSSIGKQMSSGCIRMLCDDVEELFRWVPHGTEIEVRGY